MKLTSMQIWVATIWDRNTSNFFSQIFAENISEAISLMYECMLPQLCYEYLSYKTLEKRKLWSADKASPQLIVVA
jgi:hypothetical protein